MRSWLVMGALLLCACAPSTTQLVVVVETNLDVPTELDEVQLSVLGPAGVATVTSQSLTDPGSPSFPLTLGVAPEGDGLGPVTVTATGRRSGAEVVSQSAQVTLVEGETLVVHLVLYRSCVGRDCAATETCDAMGCVSELRADLPAWTGVPPTFDDSDPCLAMPWDVDDDGQGSVECGGMDCADDEALAYAGATEDCDDIDNNCDGVTDEDCDCSPLGMMEECDTACGSVGDRMCQMDGWTACAVRDESCNGVDDDCDGLTDEGQTYVASTPSMLTTVDAPSLDPDLIWADDHYALVWADDTDRDGVHFMQLDATGAPMSPARRISADGEQPAVAWTGTSYGVTWWDRDSSTDPCCDPPTCAMSCTVNSDRVYMIVLDATGAFASGVERIESNADWAPRPKIVFDGTDFIIGYRDGGVYLEHWSTSAVELAGRYEIPSTRRDDMDMVFDGSEIAVAWGSGDNLDFSIGTFGAFPTSQTSVATLASPDLPAMVSTGEGFVIGAPTSGAGIGLDIVSLDAAGTPRGTVHTLSTTLRDGGFYGEAAPPGMAASPGQVLVTWSDIAGGTADVWFARVAFDGTVLQPATLLATTPAVAGMTSVAWSGDHFGVVWSENPEPGDEVLVFSRVACAP